MQGDYPGHQLTLQEYYEALYCSVVYATREGVCISTVRMLSTVVNLTQTVQCVCVCVCVWCVSPLVD